MLKHLVLGLLSSEAAITHHAWNGEIIGGIYEGGEVLLWGFWEGEGVENGIGDG